MLFQKKVTIPITATETAKIHETLRTAVGILDRLWIEFPAGCHGLVNIQVFQAKTPLAPSEQNQTLVGDDVTFLSTHNTEIKQGYETLDIYGWAVGTTYSHTIVITANVFTTGEYSRLETLTERVAKQIETLNKFLGVPSV